MIFLTKTHPTEWQEALIKRNIVQSQSMVLHVTANYLWGKHKRGMQEVYLGHYLILKPINTPSRSKKETKFAPCKNLNSGKKALGTITNNFNLWGKTTE